MANSEVLKRPNKDQVGSSMPQCYYFNDATNIQILKTALPATQSNQKSGVKRFEDAFEGLSVSRL